MATVPLRNFSYRLEIDGIEQAGFAEVAIGDASTEPIEYREGIDTTTVRKFNGLNKYGNITLKWGITDSTELADWHQMIVDDATPLEDAQRNVVIRMRNDRGEDQVAFEITKAWPCKYDPTDLNGKGNEVAIDTLELCNEGIRRIQ
ncbi:MAG: phage tail protein [Gammaproteobacteria bacterium]|nr:phage tail protein [Alphaproteobacteria bacterium]MBU2410167.1 phage tail protein [Gammaproteobacteria bacterium]